MSTSEQNCAGCIHSRPRQSDGNDKYKDWRECHRRSPCIDPERGEVWWPCLPPTESCGDFVPLRLDPFEEAVVTIDDVQNALYDFGLRHTDESSEDFLKEHAEKIVDAMRRAGTAELVNQLYFVYTPPNHPIPKCCEFCNGPIQRKEI